MHNKKYIFEKIEEFNGHNRVYEDMPHRCVCYLAYLNEGERGWFMYETGLRYDVPHRIHTSIIKNVEYRDGLVIVTTQNTRLTFKEVG